MKVYSVVLFRKEEQVRQKYRKDEENNAETFSLRKIMPIRNVNISLISRREFKSPGSDVVARLDRAQKCLGMPCGIFMFHIYCIFIYCCFKKFSNLVEDTVVTLSINYKDVDPCISIAESGWMT